MTHTSKNKINDQQAKAKADKQDSGQEARSSNQQCGPSQELAGEPGEQPVFNTTTYRELFLNRTQQQPQLSHSVSITAGMLNISSTSGLMISLIYVGFV